MHNESKNNFLLLLALSIAVHIALILAVLFIQYDDFIRFPHNTEPKAHEAHTAQVIFQQPHQQTPPPAQQQRTPQPTPPLPAPFVPLIEEKKQEPVVEQKKPMLLTGGDAALAQPASAHQEPVKEKLHKKPMVNPEPHKQEKPAPQPELKQPKPEAQQKLQEQHEFRPETNQNGTHKADNHAITQLVAEKKQNVETPKPAQPFVHTQAALKHPVYPAQKKLTLADIANGFIHKAPSEHSGTGISATSNHVATVIGAPAGAATEEQLRYERYAVKLIACINNSFTILYPQLKYVHRPSVREANFAFVMDVNNKGDIVGLMVKQGSGNREFDDFMVKLLYHASRSFPPLPSYFKANVCSFPMLCTMPTGAV